MLLFAFLDLKFAQRFLAQIAVLALDMFHVLNVEEIWQAFLVVFFDEDVCHHHVLEGVLHVVEAALGGLVHGGIVVDGVFLGVSGHEGGAELAVALDDVAFGAAATETGSGSASGVEVTGIADAILFVVIEVLLTSVHDMMIN